MSGDEPLLLDSVIVIDHFNGVDAASEYLRTVLDRVSVSAITRAEVLTGFDAAASPLVRKLLERFGFVPIERDVADLAAELRREHGWRLPDALQAAAASARSMKLVTRNTRDFNPKRHPFVEIPYTL